MEAKAVGRSLDRARPKIREVDLTRCAELSPIITDMPQRHSRKADDYRLGASPHLARVTATPGAIARIEFVLSTEATRLHFLRYANSSASVKAKLSLLVPIVEKPKSSWKLVITGPPLQWQDS